MKNLSITVITVFILSVQTQACSCDNGFIGINNHFITSDYVVMAKILESHDSPSAKSKYHRIKIYPLEIYKGNTVEELKVWSNKGHEIISSCGISPNKGEYWLIYAQKTENGDYAFGYCSKSEELTEKSYHLSKDEWVENDYTWLIKNLEFLQKHASDINRDFYVVESGSALNEFLEGYDNVTFDEFYGQYLITFNKNFEVKSIEILSSLSEKFDQKLTSYITNQTKWKPFYPIEPKKGFKHILGIYHYTDSYPFLTEYFLR